MRKTLIALEAATGLGPHRRHPRIGGAGSVSPHAPAQTAVTQPADWYCDDCCERPRHGWGEHHPYYGYAATTTAMPGVCDG
jgi:hypothetical protein